MYAYHLHIIRIKRGKKERGEKMETIRKKFNDIAIVFFSALPHYSLLLSSSSSNIFVRYFLFPRMKTCA